MKIKVDLTGIDKSALLRKLENKIGLKAVYLRTPTFNHQLGNMTISRAGVISADNNKYKAKVIEALKETSYDWVDEEADENSGLTFSRLNFTSQQIDNLKKLIASKKTLIEKALGIEETEIAEDDEWISFNWFDSEESIDDSPKALFITKLVEAAKEAKWIVGNEKPVENEKYAFRCFLLRLGFVGDEYKSARKSLLKNLSGNSAFKSERPKNKAEIHTN